MLSIIKKHVRNFIERFFPSAWFNKKSFSQDGEDLVLKSLLNYKKGYKGFYVDIGAHHPYRFSNTAIFYNQGWKGINIEPTPSLIPAFNRNRKRDTTVNVGISNDQGNITFYEFNEPALNSFDKELSLKRVEETNYEIKRKVEIPINTLSNILQQNILDNQQIDFFTIDTEGYDLKVLQSNNWQKFKPNFILVECDTDFDKLNNDVIYIFLKGKGYQLKARTKRTSIFKKID